MHRKPIVPIILLALIITATILYFEVFRHWGENPNQISGSGTIEVTEIEIASKIPGRITALPYEEGQQVKKGAVLVRLDFGELAAQQNSARASLANAEANFTRTKNLFKSGSVSQRDYDNAEAAYKTAKAAADLILANIDNAILTAPVTGTILEKNLEEGEMAFPGSAIMTLGELEKPWMKIYVPETKLGLVKIGQKVIVNVDSFPKRNFEGRIISISSKAEFTPKTIQTKDERVKLMFAVKISLNNPDQDLKPGMPADAIVLEDEK